MADLRVKDYAVFATRTTSTSSGPVLQELVAWLRYGLVYKQGEDLC